MNPAAEESRSPVSVQKTITVNTSLQRAFDVFTKDLGAWWPLRYHIACEPMQTAIIEPRVGGRFFERGADHSECDWGHVRVWEPPHRLVFSWEISSEWKPEENSQAEVEVRFLSQGPNTTRVDLDHRHLDWYGDHAEMIRSTVDSDQGWPLVLREFAAAANRVEISPEETHLR